MSNASWLQIPRDSPFSLANIPFGIISTAALADPRPAVAIGDYALDLFAFSSAGGFSKLSSFSSHIDVFTKPTLNDFAALGRPVHREVRGYLQDIFRDSTPYPEILKTNEDLKGKALVPLKDVTNHLPMKIGDYTDFYAGLNHAFNVGVLFRGPDNALQPNYKHLPVGYHGRASSVIVSGQPVRRPNGQILANPAATPKVPIFSPCKKLDIELELAVFVGKGNKLGEPIPIDQAEDHLFGVVLMNDWSARDIQAWEYVPLGPFNAKNFATSITPWVVLMDALEPFRSTGLAAEEGLDNLLPYLREKRAENVYDMQLQFDLKPANSSCTSTVAKTNAKNLLYSFAQMLTHHSVTGCNMNTGDLLGSGTISGKETGTLGSLLENTQGGKQPMKLSDGSERVFLEDGDEVTLKGICGEEGSYVGFGNCTATILPAPVIN
ncbi:fumarylacetoacetase [Trichophyton rubrum D6]|uniref:Fumarylacetoacetase n=3 Tax=Trichophyton TaxID=5550 RepID=A0A178EUU5_TRIRU|nr:fumarylacetoacetase [Trichophyton rubrum MR850]EZF38293.1 fumarylacetoacetase [Trichophyton rubrum CBS 100081]EZF48910.1 fumarylacetoacetase [Trichophyton rubrum CBS 288.86]EZF59559.1 fumarylacetoacetase [Trichophyton rubrum CBS 289.86]EZF70195.1 fumarylacetoacetase [Trichophyton soudanense CBS 452.61]EZF80793.1 fumarylacetoacetase [Trichophyton rubrum MR1448]EZG02451.1 fumarylacetoacetase [Trichophyton rubrum CBS 735.88]EZG13059.1 fumarylacetoacetase [Trichophyton rubrum CBS 202.88]KDB3